MLRVGRILVSSSSVQHESWLGTLEPDFNLAVSFQLGPEVRMACGREAVEQAGDGHSTTGS